MTPNDLELARRFPFTLAELLLPYDASKGSPLAERGIECGSGWLPLLEALFGKLEAEIFLVPQEERASYRVAQVKEKFGELRVYMDHITARMEAAIQEAEQESRVTCDICSAPGQVRTTNGWLAARCEEHKQAEVSVITVDAILASTNEC